MIELRSKDECELNLDKNRTEKSLAGRGELPMQDRESKVRMLRSRKKTKGAKDEDEGRVQCSFRGRQDSLDSAF